MFNNELSDEEFDPVPIEEKDARARSESGSDSGEAKRQRMFAVFGNKVTKIAELFSPNTIGTRADLQGVESVGAFDLRINDPVDGKPWDLDSPSKLKRAINMIKKKSVTLF